MRCGFRSSIRCPQISICSASIWPMTDERISLRDALGAFAPGEALRGALLLTYNLDGLWFEEVFAPELFDRSVENCLLVRDGRAVQNELRSVRCIRANAGYSTRVFHP